jgi:hypothetical protein
MGCQKTERVGIAATAGGEIKRRLEKVKAVILVML